MEGDAEIDPFQGYQPGEEEDPEGGATRYEADCLAEASRDPEVQV